MPRAPVIEIFCCYARIDRVYKEALDTFEIAIGLNSDDSWLHLQKAITLRDFEDYE